MILLDTNIIIYLSKRVLNIEDVINDENEIYAISIITYMEVLGYVFENKKEEEFVKKFLSFLKIIPINMKIAKKVIELKKEVKIKLPDAIICATAYIYNANLITNDKKLENIFKNFKEQK